MQADHFGVNIGAIAPAPIPEGDGWVPMDIRYVDGGTSGFDGVCLFRVVFDAGVERGRHRHPNAAEFLLVLSGIGACGFLENEHEVGPGSLEMIPRGMPHWIRNTGHDPLVVVGGYLGVPDLAAAGYQYLGPLTDSLRQVRPPRPARAARPGRNPPAPGSPPRGTRR